MKKNGLLCLLVSVLFLISCNSGSSSNDGSDECTVAEKNEIIYDIMKDTYLWYDQVPDVDPSAYSEPELLLEDLMYSTLDQWSYIITYEEYIEYYEEGQYPGMGFSAGFDDTGRVWIEYVYTDSPAYTAGIERSDEILEINGLDVSSFSDLYELWAEIYRYSTAYIRLKPSEGDEFTCTLAWDWVTINTVLYWEIIAVGDQDVGYLVFDSFIEPSLTELDSVFETFKSQEIDELILDLRYNGGGRLDVAGYLASLISYPVTAGEMFVEVQFNDKYQAYNDSMIFPYSDKALGLSRVFIITTESTCSASESVINSLEPFLDVITIGSTTCGKPVGMTAHRVCDLVLLPIEFRTANSDGDTDYFDGLAPDCEAEDDLEEAFGSDGEDSLATAIYYIEHDDEVNEADKCKPVSTSATRTLKAATQQKNQRNGFWREIRAF